MTSASCTYFKAVKRGFVTAFVLLCCMRVPAQDLGARMRDNLFLYYGENASEKIRNNLVCTAKLNRNRVYKGEPAVVTYKLYSALQSFSVVEKMPPFNGFSVYEIKAPHDPIAAQLNGRWYNAYNIRILQLYPGEPGTFTLEPAVIKNTVTFQQSAETARQNNPALPDGYVPEDEIPGYTKMQYEYRSFSDKPVIEVLPLPEQGRPNSFSGAVGKFNIAAVCRETDVEQNSAVKVVYTISGSGNFKAINELPVARPAAFETFDPVIKEELNELVAPFAGKKTFEYTFSPLQQGKAVIPAVEFSYFDPSTASYYTIKTDSIRLNVIPARKRDTPVRDEKMLNDLNTPSQHLFLYMVIGGLLFLAGVILYFKQRKNKPVAAVQEETVDEDFWKPEPRLFEQSERMVNNAESTAFYPVLYKELHLAMMRLLGLPSGTTSTVYETIKGRNETLATEYQALVQELNNIIYAYIAPENKPATYLQRAKHIAEGLKA